MHPSRCSLVSSTSSVEELPGIFSRESKVPWDTAQELYDVGYVVYRGQRGGEGKEREKFEGKWGRKYGKEE